MTETTISRRILPFAAAAVALTALGWHAPTAEAAEAAEAGTLAPIEAKTIALGLIEGVAYYTVEPDGLRVVATVAAGETAFRVISTLTPDQKMTLAVPGAEGGDGQTIEFTRDGDLIRVSESLPLAN